MGLVGHSGVLIHSAIRATAPQTDSPKKKKGIRSFTTNHITTKHQRVLNYFAAFVKTQVRLCRSLTGEFEHQVLSEQS